MLMAIIESIQNELEKGEYAAGIFIDLKKAFDTVDLDILIDKLEHYVSVYFIIFNQDNKNI